MTGAFPVFMELNFNVEETDTEKVRVVPFQTKTVHHLSSDEFSHNVLRKPAADAVGALPLALRSPHFWCPK